MKFVKHYSLEIYTLISILLITFSATMITPDLIQKISLGYILLFMLHEWEEGHYPGGFTKLVMGVVLGEGNTISDQEERESRVIVAILLMSFAFIPFFAHNYAWLVLPAAFLSIFEGIIHIIVTKVFGRGKLYAPGLVTAECELILGVFTIWILLHSGLIKPIYLLGGFLLFMFGYMMMQRKLVQLRGMRYRDLPQMAKSNLKRILNSKK